MSWEHLCIYLSFSWVGLCLLKARSLFVLRGLSVELCLCKAVVGGRGLSCLTLVILGLFPVPEKTCGYLLIPVRFQGPLCAVCPGNVLLFCWSLCRGSVHVLTEPCSPGGAGGCLWVLLPLLSSLSVSPVNQTLQALGSTVTQEQGVLPLSPAPLAFLLFSSLQILSKGKKISCK